MARSSQPLLACSSGEPNKCYCHKRLLDKLLPSVQSQARNHGDKQPVEGRVLLRSAWGRGNAHMPAAQSPQEESPCCLQYFPSNPGRIPIRRALRCAYKQRAWPCAALPSPRDQQRRCAGAAWEQGQGVAAEAVEASSHRMTGVCRRNGQQQRAQGTVMARPADEGAAADVGAAAAAATARVRVRGKSEPEVDPPPTAAAQGRACRHYFVARS